MLSLVVSVNIIPERLEEFLAAITTNAERTFNDEAGCKYFDATQDKADPHHFIFYELYEDEAAIEAHRAAPHFKVWREAAGRCCVPGSQTNTICELRIHHI